MLDGWQLVRLVYKEFIISSIDFGIELTIMHLINR